MFEHANGVDRVEAFVDFPIVLQADLDRQAGTKRAGIIGLFLRYGDADAFDPIVFGGVFQCLAPAAADVEHALAGLQLELAADQVELGSLRVIEMGCLGPIAAGIHQPLAQHGLEQVVAEVVVHLADLECPLATLQVDEARLQVGEQGVEGFQLLVEPGSEQSGAQAGQVVGIPPAVHVTLAQPQRTMGEDPCIQALIVYAKVDRGAAVDSNAGLLQQFAGADFQVVLAHALASLRDGAVKGEASLSGRADHREAGG